MLKKSFFILIFYSTIFSQNLILQNNKIKFGEKENQILDLDDIEIIGYCSFKEAFKEIEDRKLPIIINRINKDLPSEKIYNFYTLNEWLIPQYNTNRQLQDPLRNQIQTQNFYFLENTNDNSYVRQINNLLELEIICRLFRKKEEFDDKDLASIYLFKSQYSTNKELIIKYAKKLLESNQASLHQKATAKLILGKTFTLQQRYEEAVKNLSEGLEVRELPPQIIAYYQVYLGIALSKLNSLEEAEKILINSLQSNQINGHNKLLAQFHLGNTLLWQCKFKEAERYLTYALENNPFQNEMKILTKLIISVSLIEQNKLKDALNYYLTEAEMDMLTDTGQFFAKLHIIIALLKENKLEEAEVKINHIFEKTNKNPLHETLVNFYLTVILLKSNQSIEKIEKIINKILDKSLSLSELNQPQLKFVFNKKLIIEIILELIKTNNLKLIQLAQQVCYKYLPIDNQAQYLNLISTKIMELKSYKETSEKSTQTEIIHGAIRTLEEYDRSASKRRAV